MADGPATLRRRMLLGPGGSQLPLRFLYLLAGSALALSFASIDLAVAGALWDRPPLVANRFLVTVTVLLPPTLAGLLSPVRVIEGAAATALLGVDFRGQPPGPTRTWDQRWRALAWFWAHLVAGGLAGVVVVGGVVCVGYLVRAFDGREDVLGLPWARASGAWEVAGVIVAAGLVVAVGYLLLVAFGAAMAWLAPLLLGPSVPELLAELDARTTHLVERTRLARELHDSVGHALTVIVLQTAVARRRLPPGADATAGSLGVVEDVAQRALAELDAVLGLLREDRTTAERLPIHDLDSLDGLLRAAREGGQQVVLSSDVDVADLPPVVSREAYRIVQEGVTNALRHAVGQPVDVRLTRPGGAPALRVQVSNPVPAGSAPDGRGGRGLVGIRERVGLLGGRVHAGARDDSWCLDVTLPLPRQEAR
jgi:signal transduction histidine kinase